MGILVHGRVVATELVVEPSCGVGNKLATGGASCINRGLAGLLLTLHSATQ